VCQHAGEDFQRAGEVCQHAGEDFQRTGEVCQHAGKDFQRAGGRATLLAKIFSVLAKIFST
jgi:hypothetical protein